MNSLGVRTYALDLRGFGATPRDSSGYCTPQRCVKDVHSVMEWLHQSQQAMNPGAP
eukprot:CAMPEP_0118979036 /NCGR_PEP_ID=MMETSP1173-20130426/25033_1 /TAXON_ID=1034831 /ORGANISM="Rhizochromulina marina cf, Strain CCMP1243" /LENGTH=55 /DNA_ID=CAMNT_0006929277 /DNA_START=36 /DNA_END=199 /DNA_ORIENTATION=-